MKKHYSHSTTVELVVDTALVIPMLCHRLQHVTMYPQICQVPQREGVLLQTDGI